MANKAIPLQEKYDKSLERTCAGACVVKLRFSICCINFSISELNIRDRHLGLLRDKMNTNNNVNLQL